MTEILSPESCDSRLIYRNKILGSPIYTLMSQTDRQKFFWQYRPIRACDGKKLLLNILRAVK